MLKVPLQSMLSQLTLDASLSSQSSKPEGESREVVERLRRRRKEGREEGGKRRGRVRDWGIPPG